MKYTVKFVLGFAVFLAKKLLLSPEVVHLEKALRVDRSSQWEPADGDHFGKELVLLVIVWFKGDTT